MCKVISVLLSRLNFNKKLFIGIVITSVSTVVEIIYFRMTAESRHAGPRVSLKKMYTVEEAVHEEREEEDSGPAKVKSKQPKCTDISQKPYSLRTRNMNKKKRQVDIMHQEHRAVEIPRQEVAEDSNTNTAPHLPPMENG